MSVRIGAACGYGRPVSVTGIPKGTVVMNTGFRAPRVAMDLSRAHALVKTPLVGEFVVEAMSSFFKRLAGVQGDPTTMPPEVMNLIVVPGRQWQWQGDAGADANGRRRA